MGGTAPSHRGRGEKTILTKVKMCAPYMVCGKGVWVGHIVEEVMVLDYLRCSEGVSCNTSSHI